jgi:alpha-methylacyl-CoA racemase
VRKLRLLQNLKIIDFSTLLPGPFATLLLADLGAEVLHIKRPTHKKAEPIDDYLHRSKKWLTLDLKLPESIEKVKELVLEYDILLEQFRPGVMNRLGIGYEDLKRINPKLIYCSLTGYGQTGPYKDRPGHDINYLSISGVAGTSGTIEQGPAQNSTQIADIAGGSLHAGIAMLAAVIYRERTGEGQYIDISMTDCSFTLNAVSAPGYFINGTIPKPENQLLNGGTFYGYYQTKDERFFSVGSLEPSFRTRLCEAIGRTDLLDICQSHHMSDIATFKEALKETFLLKTFSEWTKIFREVEACVEPVLTFPEVCEHPQLVERGMIVNVPLTDGGMQKQIGCPIKTSVFTPIYNGKVEMEG